MTSWMGTVLGKITGLMLAIILDMLTVLGLGMVTVQRIETVLRMVTILKVFTILGMGDRPWDGG